MVNTTQTPAQVYPSGAEPNKADIIRFEQEMKAGVGLLSDDLATEKTARSAALTAEAAARAAAVAAARSDLLTRIATEESARSTDVARLDVQVSDPVRRAPLFPTNRPGDTPWLHSDGIKGGDPYSADPVVSTANTSEGDVARLNGAGIVSDRMMYAMEPGRTYRARFVVRRVSDSTDPSNDAVVLGLAWFDRTKNPRVPAFSAALEMPDLSVADGRTVFEATISRDEGADIQPPAGTVYAKPFVRAYGTSPITDVEIIDWQDVTDLSVWAPDVSEFSSRLTALETFNIQPRLNELEQESGTSSTMRFASRNDAEATSIRESADVIDIPGFGTFKRSLVSHAFMSLDGAVWSPIGLYNTPEQFGVVGDGMADDTEAFRRMLQSEVRAFWPDPNKRYRISGQLDFGERSVLLGRLNIFVNSSREVAHALSPGAQTGGLSQHRTLLVFQGEHWASGIDILQNPHPTLPWLALVGNDFYLHGDGSRPSYDTNVRLGGVTTKSTAWVDGYSGDGNGAIRFQGMRWLDTGDIEAENFAIVGRISDIDVPIHGDIDINQARLGIQWTRCDWVIHGDIDFQGSVENRIMAAGNNALVIRACRKLVGGTCVVKDTGEHGIRVTSQYAVPGGIGNFAKDMFTDLTQGDINVYRSGGSGYKADSGSASVETRAPIRSVSLGKVYVEDAGASEFGPGATIGLANNHFGLNLQYLDQFVCKSLVTKKEGNTYNGRHNILLRNVRNVIIPNSQLEGAYSDAIFCNFGADEVYENIQISGTIRSFGDSSSTSNGVRILNPHKSGSVKLDLEIVDGPRSITFQDVGGNPEGPWEINILWKDVDNPDVSGLGNTRNRYRIRTRAAIRQTSSAELQFDVEKQLLCKGVGGSFSVLRNGEVDVYLSTENNSEYIAVPQGADTSALTGIGARLYGFWRGCGQVVNDRNIMVVRVY